jgi:hypothetical protein
VRINQSQGVTRSAFYGIALQEVVREAGLDGRGFVQALHMGGAEFNLCGAKRIFNLFRTAGAYDGDDELAALHRPTHRDLDGGDTHFRSNGSGHFSDAGTAFVAADAVLRHTPWLAAQILSTECPAGQDGPRSNGQVESFGHGEEIALRGALDQAVFQLQGGKAVPAAQLGQHVGAGDDPGRGVGDADVVDFAHAGEVFQTAHHLFDGRGGIPKMHPEQIDAIDVQALEAGLDATHHVLAVVAGKVGVVGAVVQGVFGGDDKVVAVGDDVFADPFLRGAFGVAVGGIEKVAAGVGVGIKDGLRLLVITAKRPFGAKGHGAEADF